MPQPCVRSRTCVFRGGDTLIRALRLLFGHVFPSAAGGRVKASDGALFDFDPQEPLKSPHLRLVILGHQADRVS